MAEIENDVEISKTHLAQEFENSGLTKGLNSKELDNFWNTLKTNVSSTSTVLG
jgi:hypothetical protein